MAGERYPEVQSLLRAELPEIDQRFAELREAFLIDFRLNTARAYWGDLEHFSDAQREVGSSVLGASNAELFRYLRAMQATGYSAGTLRRRMTCLRGFYRFVSSQGAALAVDLDAVAQRLRQAGALALDSGTTSAMVVSDDVIVRNGLTACLTASGIVDTHVGSLSMPESGARQAPACDYVVAHLATGGGVDRLAGISSLPKILRDSGATTVIVLAALGPTALQRLRLVESGCSFIYPYNEVAAAPESFAAALRTAQMNEQYRLPSQWALRQVLGLHWDGALGPFLEAASKVPREVWTTHRPQSALPIDRAQVRELQRLARDGAGLPEPDFRRYASSTRRPPELPEWREVQNFVRELWGLNFRARPATH